ncbi:hypothetical protein D3C86_1726220 [compost metagenome]
MIFTSVNAGGIIETVHIGKDIKTPVQAVFDDLMNRAFFIRRYGFIVQIRREIERPHHIQKRSDNIAAAGRKIYVLIAAAMCKQPVPCLRQTWGIFKVSVMHH